MSTYSTYNPRIMMRGGANPADEMLPAIEGTTQSYKIRELVYLDSGAITVCGTNPAVIAGIAAQAASGTTGAVNYFYPLYSNDEVLMFVYTGGSTDAIAATDLGVEYGVTAASNVWYLDLNKTSNDTVVVKRLLYDAQGTLLTDRAIVSFLGSNLQFEGAGS